LDSELLYGLESWIVSFSNFLESWIVSYYLVWVCWLGQAIIFKGVLQSALILLPVRGKFAQQISMQNFFLPGPSKHCPHFVFSLENNPLKKLTHKVDQNYMHFAAVF
jgi:hypothetical protein